MNTPDFKEKNPTHYAKQIAFTATVLAFLASCRKQDVTYGLNDFELYDDASQKDKLKSSEQYIKILYTQLFHTPPTENYLAELSMVLTSIGDQEMAREIVVSNFFNNANVSLPTVQEMNADLGLFVEDTFRNFYLRLPSEAEKEWVVQYIQQHSGMTPELVYFSFALSNEYLHY